MDRLRREAVDMHIEPQASSMSIVLIGSFNPAIVDPYWLKAQNFISDQLSDGAEIEVISPEFSRFSVGKFQFDVVPERMQITNLNPPFVLLYDLAIRLFGEVLPHVKVDVFGLNYTVHFSLGSVQERLRVGRMLAPVSAWGEWGAEWENKETTHMSGVSNITMTELHKDAPYNRKTSVTVQPSIMVPHNTGVYVNVNDNFECPPKSSGGDIAPILKKNFDPFTKRAEWIIDQVMKLGERNK